MIQLRDNSRRNQKPADNHAHVKRVFLMASVVGASVTIGRVATLVVFISG